MEAPPKSWKTYQYEPQKYYLPAAAVYRERAADRGAVGKRIVNWRHVLEQRWTSLRLGEVEVETHGEQYVFEVQAHLDEIDPEAVRVELDADAVEDSAPVRQEMERVRQLAGATDGYAYRARVFAAPRPATDYTVRLIPHHDGVAVPLEAAHILWQR